LKLGSISCGMDSRNDGASDDDEAIT
jgi:hypothetical protein